MEAFDLNALLGPAAAQTVDALCDRPAGCDAVTASQQRHKIDAIVSGMYPDALSESTRLEAVRDLLLLQNAAAGGVNVDALLGKATNVLRNQLAAALQLHDSALEGQDTFTTKRAFREVDTNVSWLARGLSVATNICAAAQTQNWSSALALLGEFHTSVLIHSNIEAYAHIYPISKVRCSLPLVARFPEFGVF